MGFKVDAVALNVFVFTFKSPMDRDRVWEWRPWSVNDAHLVFKEWRPNNTINKIDFCFSSFWVQVHRLPLKFLNSANVTKVGSLIGHVNLVQSAVNQSFVGMNYTRLNVDLDLTHLIPFDFFP